MRSSSLGPLFSFLLVCWLTLPAIAQTGDPEVPISEDAPQVIDRAAEQERLATLQNILDNKAALETAVDRLKREQSSAQTDEQKQLLSERIKERWDRVEALERDFSVLAAGIDPDAFFEPSVDSFDWQDEVEQILAPVLIELKSASAHPRELEALRSELALISKHLPLTEGAVSGLQRLLEVADDPNLSRQLAELEEFWTRQRDELENRYASTQQQLKEKEKERAGIGHAAAEIVRIFFHQRFINLLSALLAFAVIFFLLRLLHRFALSRLPSGGSQGRQMMVRLIDISYYLFTIVAAFLGLLVMLYLSADWVLLTLAVLLLVGAAWATRNAIPVFFEQIRLLLNLGAVREEERLIYQGIPWKVATLGFFSELKNPLLRGGVLRLPLKDLVGLRSRAPADDEPWFPSKMGDWVIASDDTYGEVVEQTPEVVVLSTVRGSYKHYGTVDYLAHRPKNLSTNFFSVNHTVGLDYRYRSVINSEIAPILKQGIREGFEKEPYGEHLVQVIAELQEMGASSLDLITIVKFRGGAASEYFEIGWRLQQIALDICNEHGWDIPFPQLVVHRPEATS